MLSPEKFGFNTFWWEKLHTPNDIRGCVEGLAEIGYRAVEFKTASFNPDRPLDAQFRGAVKIAQGSALAVSDFVVLRDPVGGNLEGAIEDVSSVIRAAASAGVDKVNTATGSRPKPKAVSDDWWNPPREDLSEAYGRLYRAFEAYLKVAEEEGVYLVVEPVAGCMVSDAGTTWEFLRHFESPRMAITLDPSHFFLARDDIAYTIRELGDRIKHVHVKDAVGRTGELGRDFIFPLLGEGGIDWSAFFRSLDDIGYDGYLSVEFESFKYMYQILRSDPLKAARLSYEALSTLFELYRSGRVERL